MLRSDPAMSADALADTASEPIVKVDALRLVVAMIEISPLTTPGPYGVTRRCLASWVCQLAQVDTASLIAGRPPRCAQVGAAGILLDLPDSATAQALFGHDGTTCDNTPATVASLRAHIRAVLGVEL